MKLVEPRTGDFVDLFRGKNNTHVPVVINFSDSGRVSAAIEMSGIVGIGEARCNPIDHYNEDIGISIATARAVKNIVEQIEQQWVSRARTKEAVKVKRESKKKQSVTV